MTYDDGMATLLQGDALDVMAEMPEKSVDVIISSPPYWGLRVYANEQERVWNGAVGCSHEWGEQIINKAAHHEGETNPGKEGYTKDKGAWGNTQGQFCQRCGAWRGSFGNEPSVALFIAHLMEFMAAIKRVLKDTGVAYINLSDSYMGSGAVPGGEWQQSNTGSGGTWRGGSESTQKRHHPSDNLLPLNLAGVPQRFFLACQEQGWIVRSEIILAKDSPMPESVRGARWERCRVKVGTIKNGGIQIANKGSFTAQSGGTDLLQWADCLGCERCIPHGGLVLRKGSWRPTSSHEKLFMLTKGDGYWADGEDVRMPSKVSANVIQFRHEREEEMQSMSPGIAPDGVLRSEGAQQLSLDVQGLRQGEGNGMAEYAQRARPISPSTAEILPDGKGPDCTETLREFGESEELLQSLSSDEQLQGHSKEGQSIGEGQGSATPILSNRERQGGKSTKTCKAPSAGEYSGQLECERMGGDKEGAEESLLLLSSEETSDPRPFSSSQQGRLSHEAEYSSGLPQLQFNQERQALASLNTGRNLIDVWPMKSSAFTMQLCKSCKRVYTGAQFGRLANTADYACADCGGKLALTEEWEWACLDCERLYSKAEVGKMEKRKLCRCGASDWLSHFAAFHPSLPTTCILASTSAKGNCSKCGMPWARVIEKENMVIKRSNWAEQSGNRTASSGTMVSPALSKTLDWKPSCQCGAEPEPAVILDPFNGTASTGIAAKRLGRRYIGIDLSEDYLLLSGARLAAETAGMI